MLYRDDEHRQLVELVIDASHYLDRDVSQYRLKSGVDQFRLDYCATKFLSKSIGLKTGINLEEVAIASAEEAELRCLKTNSDLRELSSNADVNPSLNRKFFLAQQLIAAILGPLPSKFEDVGWSKGRTSAACGDEVAGIYKYTSRPDTTLSAWSSALELLRDSHLWGAAVFDADGPSSALPRALTIVDGNTMITVPKSAKTDRVICYEPHMNIRLQLAVGSYIRRRLLMRGINLNDQSVNQKRALRASLTGEFATIDLSMASDTLSVELVFQLLPIDWAVKLDRLRSRYTLWPDNSLRMNEKFSSMGNGFTFELESLIFYALASVETANVSVYGDDIILPTVAYEQVSDLLVSSGFKLNQRKSFATGPFRESCGMDAFGGVDCTPVYLRRLPKTKEDIVKLHNAIRAWCGRGKPFSSYQLMLRKWRNIHTSHLGPSGYGDGHYHVDFEDATPVAGDDGRRIKTPSGELEFIHTGWTGWWFKTYARITRINTLYGDRVAGHFSGRFAFAALCVAIGPKASESIIDSSADRRLWKYKLTRTLAHFEWPGIVWVSEKT
jgi:hypothetical protein